MTETPGPGAEHLWEAVGGADAGEPDPRTLLGDLYGHNARGGPDAKAAAADLGVSERTVRRWAKEGIPAHVKGAETRAAHQELRQAPEYRSKHLGGDREERLRKGGEIRIKGRFQVSGADRQGTRWVALRVGSEEMSDIIDALLAGNDTAALEALEDVVGAAFGGEVGLSLDELDLGRL